MRGRVQLAAAFGAIYLIWGSTFLSIRYAIETIPPFLMIGWRCLFAGAILYVPARIWSGERPTLRHWASATVIGAILFAGGQGLLAAAEVRVPSGVAALFLGTIPIMMTLLEAGGRIGLLSNWVRVGLVLGLAGIAILANPSDLIGGEPIDPLGAVALLVSSFAWAVGSIGSRRASMPASATLAAAMTLLAGGVILNLLGVVVGERFVLSEISLKSALNLAYLSVFGSVVAFSAYIWLMQKTTPDRVSTYAFVNPLVAVILGSLFGGEVLSQRVGFAALLLVAGVAAIVTGSARDAGGTGRIVPSVTPLKESACSAGKEVA